ncbi:MAG: SLC13 family permease [Gammaproteobacteria bacterium]|nr:MAG: SLC13 family permease [Gammaproteobacteria bacterium]
MTIDQISIVVILTVTMCLFVWNRWRYDVVAGIALLSAVFVGVIPTDHAFEGFSHPAVITVAAVLVISQALQSSGVVELFLKFLAPARGRLLTQLGANCGVTAFLSVFMNNIGALALMLPITLRDAAKAKRSAAKLLMPLSFASLLGGLVSLIGTPPNIIIATFRADNVGEPYGMFDYTPVGLAVAASGITFLVLLGWRLLPNRLAEQNANAETSSVARYMTEIRIPEDSPLVGTSVIDLEARCDHEASVMAIIRNDRRRLAPPAIERLLAHDILIVEGESDALQPLFADSSLVEAGDGEVDTELLKSPDVRVIEAVVMPNSLIEGESMRAISMHERFGVNLLGVAREGRPSRARLRTVRFRTGDVLLLQGENNALEEMCRSLSILAAKQRIADIKQRRGAILIPSVFAAGILAAAFDIVPIQIAFTAVVGLLVLLRMVSLREAYRSIEWPIIVLLGFLIPVGEALQTTGTTELIAASIVSIADAVPLWALLTIIMACSMLLSDLVHNTPTAVLMAPIAYSMSQQLGLPPDPFLMTVAIGAASPYLTPIGHQSNTLVMGPGGYRFGDYWRLGLPLDILIIAVAVPMILWVWM